MGWGGGGGGEWGVITVEYFNKRQAEISYAYMDIDAHGILGVTFYGIGVRVQGDVGSLFSSLHIFFNYACCVLS